MRSIVALFMGLVIQLSQVQTSIGAEPLKTCATPVHHMDCCEPLTVCPCAKNTEQKEKPAPLTPAVVDLKLLVSKPTATGSFEAFYFPLPEVSSRNTTRLDTCGGYSGVPLAVAFCSFVI